MKVFRKKAQDITQLFIEEIESLRLDLELISPRNPSLRSSQVSFRTRYAYEKMQALIDHQVIGDYREPDIMRFGFNPLFNNESQAIVAAQKLNSIIKENMWKNKKYTKRKLVT